MCKPTLSTTFTTRSTRSAPLTKPTQRAPRAIPSPSKLRAWLVASRPHTLTASVAPVVVGYASALRLARGDPLPGGEPGAPPDGAAAATLPHAIRFAVFTALVQVATNLHNDYADFARGADTEERVGHARATQRGWLTPRETCRGCVLCLAAALLVGSRWLIPPGGQCAGREHDAVMAFVVVSSLFNAVAYTGGPFPLGYVGLGSVSIGYSGLGDLFVFLYFGIVATLGAPYLYLTKEACLPPTSPTTWRLLYPSLLRSLPIGFLATAIIVVNNLRDRHTDVRAGKRTLAVRLGARFARAEYLLLVLGSYAFAVCFWRWERADSAATAWTGLLPLLSLPLSMPQLMAVAFGGKDGPALNAHVGGTAKLQMVYCILMAVGLVVSSYMWP